MPDYFIYILAPTLFFFPMYTIAILWMVGKYFHQTDSNGSERMFRNRLFWVRPVLQYWLLGSWYHAMMCMFVLLMVWIDRPLNYVAISSLMMVNLVAFFFLSYFKLRQVDRDSVARS